jgi:hypothetical protein
MSDKLIAFFCDLTLPSPLERVQKSVSKVLSFGEDLGEAKDFHDFK